MEIHPYSDTHLPSSYRRPNSPTTRSWEPLRAPTTSAGIHDATVPPSAILLSRRNNGFDSSRQSVDASHSCTGYGWSSRPGHTHHCATVSAVLAVPSRSAADGVQVSVAEDKSSMPTLLKMKRRCPITLNRLMKHLPVYTEHVRARPRLISVVPISLS